MVEVIVRKARETAAKTREFDGPGAAWTQGCAGGRSALAVGEADGCGDVVALATNGAPLAEGALRTNRTPRKSPSKSAPATMAICGRRARMLTVSDAAALALSEEVLLIIAVFRGCLFCERSGVVGHAASRPCTTGGIIMPSHTLTTGSSWSTDREAKLMTYPHRS
jgi:hypothetical protein